MYVSQQAARVVEVNANTLAGIQVDAATATGDLDLYYDVNPKVYKLTHNLTAAVNVGLNTRAAKRGDRWRLVRESAAPAAFAVTVKSGTAAAGSAIGTIAASQNGFIEAEFDGAAWVAVGDAQA